MADPLSVAASVLAVATAAVVSIRSLCDTVKSFQNRNNTLRRLQVNLQDLATCDWIVSGPRAGRRQLQGLAHLFVLNGISSAPRSLCQSTAEIFGCKMWSITQDWTDVNKYLYLSMTESSGSQ
jgi:hypothetical protein